MTLASDPLKSDVKPARMTCSCLGTCTGYDSCCNCPPLIVFAVLANCAAAAAPVVSDASGEMR